MADTGSSGSGYQVEVDSLRAFAGQVRSLLADFQANADGPTAHAKSGIARGSFGDFAEATALHNQYDVMRDGLKDVLIALHQAIDEAQKKADLTAGNYEEQEHRTSQDLRVTTDGWSVGSPAAAGTYSAVAAGGAAAGAAAGRSAANRAADRSGAASGAASGAGDATAGDGAVPPVAGAPAGTPAGGKRKSGGAAADQGTPVSGDQDGAELPQW
ncbi:hypothetical protein LN042_15905 [Kitasatospora sp. RB6PN24]|uniref:hypothetical protein n=1 Tax=Kitasatospora humi TaxID=2893891 RepID=UPI001E449CBA|nr:hypothetical protein [Kitasatospora humi]MCC9308552.1 hypothetical protein [Kitasatospora humi]